MDIEEVLTAFRDWAEADAQLKQAEGEIYRILAQLSPCFVA